jgi:polar amino acid transport system substrate-binding protein
MKKFYLLILLITLTLTGCANKQDNSLEDVINKGVLVVGYTEFPPMGYLDNGVVKGFDVDLAKEVGAKLNVEVKFRYIDWDSKLFELESGKIDCIWNGMTITSERLEQMEFTKKYLDNNLIVLALTSSEIDTLNDLTNKKVGVESTSSGQFALQNNVSLLNSIKEMKEYDTSNSALLALESGAIDAMIIDEIYARYYVLNKSNQFKIGSEIVGVEEYGVAFAKGNAKLKDKIDEVIDELVSNKEIEQISNKWFNTNLIAR